YDAGLEKRLVAHAVELPDAEAAALATDAMLLTESGLLSPDRALDRAAAPLGPPSFAVQREAAKLLRGIRPEWLDAKQRARREEIARTILQPVAKQLSWDARVVAGSLDPQQFDALLRARGEILPIAAEFDG